jgi:hypothetical protein
MQDTEMKEFDQQLRSMLADAEVKPSRRVWKGVSARLDADAAPAASSWGWLKWAGMSLAAAAVIAAGVFFSGTRTSIPTIIFNQSQATLAQTGETAGAPTDVAVPAAAPASEVGNPAPQADSRTAVRSKVPQAPDARPVPAPEVSGEQPEPESVASVPAETPEQAPASEPGRRPVRKPAPRVTEPAVDPFAELEPVRQAFKPRLALYAQGSVGSNDARNLPAAPGPRMAPGVQDEFTEIQGSSSTYGVPFTVGLGVRVYALPRLSIGTGIDYSLLTRTFTGGYQGTPGTVSHTIQYLGIPVRLYYDILTSDRIKFYTYGGGEVEFCIGNKYRLFGSPDIVRDYKVNSPLFSVGLGLGVEFRLGRTVGLYLDPGVNYYFPGNQPRSIRTDKPLMLNFDAGLRFNF